MDKILSLQDAIECAKKFDDFEDVYVAVSLHPEWLTDIPENRKWAIIHHVTFSGNICHLDQLLSLQTANKNFRLLAKTRDHETILDIARVVKDEGKMFRHIERLVKLDDMLNYARNCDWNKCYEIVEANPEYGNQKTPYRRYFLIHHMACANDIKQFERFSKIKNFNFILNLRADRKKINQIARENNGIEFAKYIEKTYPMYFDDDQTDDQLYEPNDAAKVHTQNVNITMEHRNVVQLSEMSIEPVQNQYTRTEADKFAKGKLIKQQQQQQRATNVIQVINDNPIDTIRNLLTCSLTHAIMTDPAVAADGFTYERLAIENWLQTNDCSPMTNAKLANKNLSPNTIVKHIIDALTQK